MPTNRAAGLQVVDPLLTQIARRYQPDGYIQDQLLSDIPVKTFTGKYIVFTDQYWFMDETPTATEDRAPSREIDYEWSTDSFDCKKHSLKVSYTDDEVDQAAQGAMDIRREKTEFLAHRFKHAREIRLAALLLASGDGGQLSAGRTSTPSVNWDQDTATIESDIKTGVVDVYDTIGIVPNLMVIPFKVAYAMAIQQDIREIMKYTVDGREVLRVGDRLLPAVIHGMRVVIPKGVQKDTAKEGGTASRSEIWGDHVRLLYVDPGAGRYKPSVLKRFVYRQPMTKRWEENDPDVTYVRVEERIDEKVVAPDAGHVLKSVLS